jgi:hypothetical protein
VHETDLPEMAKRYFIKAFIFAFLFEKVIQQKKLSGFDKFGQELRLAVLDFRIS